MTANGHIRAGVGEAQNKAKVEFHTSGRDIRDPQRFGVVRYPYERGRSLNGANGI